MLGYLHQPNKQQKPGMCANSQAMYQLQL